MNKYNYVPGIEIQHNVNLQQTDWKKKLSCVVAEGNT